MCPGWKFCGMFAWCVSVLAVTTAEVTAAEVAAAEVTDAEVTAGRIDLAGEWTVHLDPQSDFDPAQPAPDAAFRPVTLPGALRDSGLGDPVGPKTRWIGTVRDEVWTRPEYKKYQSNGQFKLPGWLQPERHYVGTAYYRRVVDIPAAWRGQRIILTLERPHWHTRVWVDRRPAGECDSLSTPHVYELTAQLAPGRHTLTIEIDNSLTKLDVGRNSHSVSDHTQTAWHGIVGSMDLRAEPKVAVEHAEVLPAENARSATILVRFTNITGQAHSDTLVLRVSQSGQLLGERAVDVTIPPQGMTIECLVPFQREAERWDEFHPQLCELEARLASDKSAAAVRRVSFGVRHVQTDGTQFVLNGRRLFLRGTLECCIFPLTGYCPTDIESWKRVIRICKSHGLNHIRFHSWCPPEAAFAAADELGFYYQVECSTWPNVTTSLGDGRPIDQWLYREGERILETYGSHPSFLLLAMGNEPRGPERGGAYLGPWVEHFRERTDRQLVTGGSGWPSIAENEFHVTPGPRIQQWGEGLRSRINAQPPATVADYREFVGAHSVPVISHEIGQWCVFPDLEEIAKYRGSLKARNFEIFRDLLDEADLGHQSRDFLIASGKLQALCYKEEIESALRTPGFGGFQLLDLHDFPGQGTALVGVLDAFWDSKPYLKPEDFRRFCGPTVLLARMPKRTWLNHETFTAEVEVSHFGPDALPDVTPRWVAHRGSEVVARGTLPEVSVAAGTLAELGRVELPLDVCEGPQQLKLTVSLIRGEQHYENDWEFWVYPQSLDTRVPNAVLVARSLSDDVIRRLESGGTVALFADPATVDSDVAIGFSSIFWNTLWTGGQSPQTLGILCDPQHPALAAFPTDSHSNWQWWELIHGSRPMVLDGLPLGLRPLVQVVPDWFRPQRLGLVWEARVGRGRLLVSSMDLDSNLDQRPVARQMRHSLLRYAASSKFAPEARVALATVRQLFREPTALQRIGAVVVADSAHPDHPAAYAIDGDPRTIWHTDWEPTPAAPPHGLTIDLRAPQMIEGVRYLPRQDMTNGRISEYAIHLSNDGSTWGRPVVRGALPGGSESHVIRIAPAQGARFIKFVAHREVNGKPYAAIAEIDIMLSKDVPSVEGQHD